MKKSLILLLSAVGIVIASCSKKDDAGQNPAGMNASQLTLENTNSALRSNVFNDTDFVKTDTIREGDYVIWSLNSHLVLDVKDRINADGAKIQQWAADSGPFFYGAINQAFHIHRLEGTLYEITSVYANDRSLDVTGHSSANGTPIQLWEFTGSANQKWQMSMVPGLGVFTIKSLESGKVVDIADNSTQNGALLHLWDAIPNSSNQMFRLYRYHPFTLNPPLPPKLPSINPTPQAK